MKGIIEYRFKSTPGKKEVYKTKGYNSFAGLILAMIKVHLQRPDIILIHKS